MAKVSEPGVQAAGLTATERRILELHASGLTRSEIALRLRRSPQTISNSLTIAKEKLTARSLSEAAVLISGSGVVKDLSGG
jgi:DNA-binding CsgD family transcriptional regulator